MFRILTSLAMLLSSQVFAQQAVKHIKLNTKNSIILDETMTPSFMEKKSLEVVTKNKELNKNEPLYIVVNTAGGDIASGMLFIDVVKSIKRPVHTISIYSGSMGYIIVQYLDKRYILNSGVLMHHHIQLPQIGGSIKGNLSHYLKDLERGVDALHLPIVKRLNTTIKEYNELIEHDVYFYGSDAVVNKQADELVTISCSDDMLTFTEKIINNRAESISNCPLITKHIGSSYSSQGKSFLSNIFKILGN